MKRLHDEDDDWQDARPALVGSAEAKGDGDDDDYPVAMLWLPDIETPKGWAMKRVPRKKPDKPRRWTGLVP